MPYTPNDYIRTDAPSFNSSVPRVNAHHVMIPSAAYTATQNGTAQINPNMRGGIFTIDVSVDPAAASVTFVVQGKDELSNSWEDILTSAAITGVGTTFLKVYPGLVAAANLIVNDILPRIFRMRAVHVDGDSMTYSVGFQGIV